MASANPDFPIAAEASPNYAVYNRNQVYNKAYAKFVAQLGDASQWGVNFAEFSQSMQMINNRALQLYRFARKLNRFDFPGAANELKKGLKPPKGLKKGAKWTANNWLEFHFGWEPLVKDIGAAVETLQSQPGPKKISVRDRGIEDFLVPKSSYYGTQNHYKYDTGVAIRAKVSVSNPNLYLANQLGFVNPLSIAWELVPFSFVVDWFSNVGQVLNSLTDFMGLDISQASVTTKQVIDLTVVTWSRDVVAQQDITLTNSWRSVYVIRQLGIPGPTLAIKPFKGFSLARGATAISLLLQQMR
jgi:hypothetical protein